MVDGLKVVYDKCHELKDIKKFVSLEFDYDKNKELKKLHFICDGCEGG